MRTVKQVSELTGISVRMLHYYDKLGLLKPSEVTDAGYRLYDDDALLTLQQILFYKELDIPLKEVKEIMYSPNYDKKLALENQRKLLILKCNRLKDLIELINKTLKGENEMSFQEFDMKEYYKALEELKNDHKDRIIKEYGSMDKYNDFIERLKSKEAEIAKMAVEKYGSIEKYVEAMKKNFNSEIFTIGDQFSLFKKDLLDDRHPRLKELFKKLAAERDKDPSSKEIQQIAEEITITAKIDYELFKMEGGSDYWHYMVRLYLLLPEWIEAVDKKYGEGAAKFIGEALKNYMGDYKPRLEMLYERLVSDLGKDPTSSENQEIVEEIAAITKKSNEAMKVDEGENHWGYTAELYLSNSNWIKVNDKKYGMGASEFIGKALKCYAESKRLSK